MRSVRRRSNLVSIGVFSLAWGSCVLFLALPFTASAAGVTYQTTRVGPASYVTNGITSPITVNVAPAGGVARYQQIKPYVSPSTLGRLGRAAIRGGGVGIAVAGIVEGLGYLIDQATGEIKKSHTEIVSTPNGGSVSGNNTCSSYRTSAQYGTTDAQYASVCGSRTYEYRGERYGQFGTWGWDCKDGRVGISQSLSHSLKCYSSVTNETVEQIIDLDPSDYAVIDNALNSGLSLSQKGALVAGAIAAASPRGTLDTSQYPVDPLTSSNTSIQQLFANWPELQQAYQQMLNAELAAVIATLDPTQQPTADEQVIVDQGTEAPPMEPPVDFELPGFCEWASFICEPFVETAQPEVPMLDLEAPEYDSGLPSTATCPAPYQVVTAFGTWDITFQFACDMASAIRTPLIAIAYLMSAFIVVGVRK